MRLSIQEKVARERAEMAQQRSLLDELRGRGARDVLVSRGFIGGRGTVTVVEPTQDGARVIQIIPRDDGFYEITTEDGRRITGNRDSAIAALMEGYNWPRTRAEEIVDRVTREREAEGPPPREGLGGVAVASKTDPIALLTQLGMSPNRLRGLYQRWVPAGGSAIGSGNAPVTNMGEVTELCRAVPVLLAMVERGEMPTPIYAGGVTAAEVDELRSQIADLDRRVRNQAKTIDQRNATIRELRSGAEETLTTSEAAQMRRAASMVELDEALMQDNGAAGGVQNLHEDNRAWLRDLVRRNTPKAGTEVNARELAKIVLSVEPMLAEIERLDEIIADALTMYPCHNSDHREAHAAGDVCDDQVTLVGLQLIQAVGLPPLYLPRVRHPQCLTCEGPSEEVQRWIDTGATADPNERLPQGLVEEGDDLGELPW